MRADLRRWVFGGSVGFFALLAIVAQLAFESRREPVPSGAPGTTTARLSGRALLPTNTPAEVGDPLGRAIEAVELLGTTDAIELQRVQQRLIDEARLSTVRFHEHFAHRLADIGTTPAHRALVFAEAFFATASESHWSVVGRFLERSDEASEGSSYGVLRGHFLERIRRAPPGPHALPMLVASLIRLVAENGDLGVARSAAQAFLALHATDAHAGAREQLRKAVLLRPPTEHVVFADLLRGG